MWAQIINTILGLWVMVSPSVLGANSELSNSNYMVGPLIMTFSITALWDINEKARLANVVLGVWLIASIFLLGDDRGAGIIFSYLATGGSIISLSLVKRTKSDTYGGGWRSLWQKNPKHLEEADKSPLPSK